MKDFDDSESVSDCTVCPWTDFYPNCLGSHCMICDFRLSKGDISAVLIVLVTKLWMSIQAKSVCLKIKQLSKVITRLVDFTMWN